MRRAVCWIALPRRGCEAIAQPASAAAPGGGAFSCQRLHGGKGQVLFQCFARNAHDADLHGQDTSFPGTAGCSWPTLTGGLWHFWGLGSAAPTRIAAGNAASSACHTPSRRLEEGKSPGGHG